MAQALSPALQGGSMIGLSGDLGAGKTTFVRHLVAAAGGDTRAVSSPTYTLQHEYKLPNGLTIEHWDLYRLTSLPLELEERTPNSVVRLIEWPERCPEVIQSLSARLSLSGISAEGEEGRRILEISGDGAEDLASRLKGIVSDA